MLNKLLVSAMMFAALAYGSISSAAESIVLKTDNTVFMDEDFNEVSTAKVAEKIVELDAKLDKGEPIYLVLNTPGGSIDYGLEMISNLSSLNRPVHTITLFAASMGFHTVQNLGTRYILADGTLMSHKARGGFGGEFPGQLDSRYNYYLKRIERMNERVVARTNGKHTKKSYDALVENEYWCDGADCVAQGFADKVAAVKCDASFTGRRAIVERFSSFGALIELIIYKSTCPVITGELDFSILINGEPLFSVNSDGTSVSSSGENSLTKEQMQAIQRDVDERRSKLNSSKKSVIKQ